VTTTTKPTAPGEHLTRREVEPTPLNGDEILSMYAIHARQQEATMRWAAWLDGRITGTREEAAAVHAEAYNALHAEIALLKRIRDARVRWRTVAEAEDAREASEPPRPPRRQPRQPRQRPQGREG
jgi:hypothetical protein